MKSKAVACLLSTFLGMFGAHWFYLGNNKRGVYYCCMFVSGLFVYVPLVVVLVLTFIDFIMILADSNFDQKYNSSYQQATPYQQPRPLYQQQLYQSHQQTPSESPQYHSTKQAKTCPYCGEEILAVAKKCKYCGEWLDKPQKVMIRCSICGEEADASLDICPSCGEKLSGRSF